MDTILLGVGMFTFVILAMVILLILAKNQLVSSGKVKIVINGDTANPVEVEVIVHVAD